MDTIRIRGARTHNLKNIDLDLPRDKLIIITGLSGSGKSSLAFDTLFAEGQRRYMESLSMYARQFLGVMERPDVDYIDGLSPVGAAAILAQTGDLRRFTSARAVVKHAGLAPRERISGTFTGRARLSGAGRPALRAAAWRVHGRGAAGRGIALVRGGAARILWWGLALAVSLPLAATAAADSLGAREIVQRAKDRDEGNPSIVDVEMILIDKSGKKRLREIRAFGIDRGEDELQLLFFLSPADLKDTGFLTYDYDESGKDDVALVASQHFNVEIGADTTEIFETSRLVSSLTGYPIQFNKVSGQPFQVRELVAFVENVLGVEQRDNVVQMVKGEAT